jgi:hypothetical protein
MCDTRLGLNSTPGEIGVSSIPVTAEIWLKLKELAHERKTDIAGVLAEAIGLEETFVQAQRTRSRMLIEKHGRVQEVVLPPHQ